MSRLLPLLALLLPASATPQIHIATVVDPFPWHNPFHTASPPEGFSAACTSTRTFPATQHMVQDLKEPPPVGLEPWSDVVPYFFGGRPYPGSWEGMDHKGGARELVKMRWGDVPRAVRGWIRERQGADPEDEERYLFGVYEGGEGGKVREMKVLGEEEGEDDLVVMFAAGALYGILPLWVAEGSDCEAELSNLERYTPTPADGSVVAWPVEVSQPDREGGASAIEFTVMAQVLRETEEGRAAREAREVERLREEEEERAREAERLREEEEERARGEAVEEEAEGGDDVGEPGPESEAASSETTGKDEL